MLKRNALSKIKVEEDFSLFILLQGVGGEEEKPFKKVSPHLQEKRYFGNLNLKFYKFELQINLIKFNS